MYWDDGIIHAMVASKPTVVQYSRFVAKSSVTSSLTPSSHAYALHDKRVHSSLQTAEQKKTPFSIFFYMYTEC